MDRAQTMDYGWTEAMKMSLTKNRTKLIETLAGSMPRIMDFLVEGGVFQDTDEIMHNTSLDTAKKRARRLLDDIPKRPARDYWTLILSLFDEQASLGHMAVKVLGVYEENGGRINNVEVRRAKRDYQENQRVGRPQLQPFATPQRQQQQPPPPQPQQQQPTPPSAAQPQPLRSPEQCEGQMPFSVPVQEAQMHPIRPQVEFQIPVAASSSPTAPNQQPARDPPGWRSEGNQVLAVDSESLAAEGERSQEQMETDADQRMETDVDQRPLATEAHGDARPKVRTPANVRNNGDGAAAQVTETKYQKNRKKHPHKVYRMESHPRGIAIIIDIEEFLHFENRPGTANDCSQLADLLQNTLHFEVRPVERNLTGWEMKQKLLEFSQDKDLAKVDSCIVVILSHGGDNDIIFGKDGRLDDRNVPVENTYIRCSDLRNWFCASSCRALEGKPKLFIFQACRGVKEDTNLGHLPVTSRSSHSRLDVGLETPQQRNQSDFCDMYFLYPTVADFVAYRGTFIPALVEVFKQHAHEMHLKDMVTELHRMSQAPLFTEPIADGHIKKFATPEERGNLPKKWYFNPPHYQPGS